VAEHCDSSGWFVDVPVRLPQFVREISLSRDEYHLAPRQRKGGRHGREIEKESWILLNERVIAVDQILVRLFVAHFT